MKQNITNRNCSDNQPIVEARRPPGYNKYELRKYTYNLPESIAPSEIKKTFNTEIVVIGAGTSGKAAALSAAEKGAQVIQIDRHVTFRWSGGQIASVNNRVQKKAGVQFDVDAICLNLMRWGANYPDQRFYRLQINAPATPRHVVRVRDVIAELRAFAANIAYLCHDFAPNP